MSDFLKVTYAAGELIFRAGDVADQLFFIQQGQVELLNAEGKAFTTLNAGESFGEQAFLSGGIRGASAQALGEVICLAEGLVGLPSAKTVITVNQVQARIIPLHKVDSFIPHLPQALRDTIRTNVMRTLGVNQLPKGTL